MPPPLLVLGAGESGVGAALLAAAQGYDVRVTDNGPIAPAYAHRLHQAGIPYEQGKHSEAWLNGTALAVKSPGIPGTAPAVQHLRAAGAEVISEIEFAYRYCPGRVVAITGSNGKTTTTSLIYHMMSHAGLSVGLGGNIGRSFAELVATERHDWYVVEVSSFQLEDVCTFRPHVALLLNITANHLNRYGGSLAAYARTKFRIATRQHPEDYFIYGHDSEVLMQHLPEFSLAARSAAFSAEHTPGITAWKDTPAGTLVVDCDPEDLPPISYPSPPVMNTDKKRKRPPLTIPTAEQQIRGKHNEYNTMAASIVGRVLDIRNELVRESMLSFQALEHRLEPVRTVNAVEYINDSKATSVNATWYALDSLDRPVVWIAGGVDKGNDYGMLLSLVKQRVKAIVLLGPETGKLEAAFKTRVTSLKHASTMEEAVRLAQLEAQPGDAVLLSPACASFDLFANYEERGRKFKEAVNRLREG